MDLSGLLFCQQIVSGLNESKNVLQTSEDIAPNELFIDVLASCITINPEEEIANPEAEISLLEKTPFITPENESGEVALESVENKISFDSSKELTKFPVKNEKPENIISLNMEALVQDRPKVSAKPILEERLVDDEIEYNVEIKKEDPIDDIISNPFISQLIQENPLIKRYEPVSVEEDNVEVVVLTETQAKRSESSLDSSPMINHDNKSENIPLSDKKEPSALTINTDLPEKTPLILENALEELPFLEPVKEESIEPLIKTEASLMTQEIKAPITNTKPQHIEFQFPADSPEWVEQFNQQIIWLGQQKIKSAVIQLNPEKMGPLHLSLEMDRDEAKLQVITQHRDIKELVELSIPRLRTMLENQGINLSDVSVESNNKQRQSSYQQSERGQFLDADPKDLPEYDIKKQGLVDYFA